MAQFLKKAVHASIQLTKNSSRFPTFYRTFMTSSRTADNYEGDGKTTVTILNREYKHLIMIDSYSNVGFKLNNGIYAMGPLAVFPKTILQWNISTIEETTPESFSLFCLLDPKIDILVLGTGSKQELPNKDILNYLKSNNICLEVMPTEKACSTFNFLNSEGRCVAGAFVPPVQYSMYEDEIKILASHEELDNFTVIRTEKVQK